jgi:hypothetical protein
MVSAVNGPGGYYPPRPMSANEKKAAQINQIVGQAGYTYRQALGSTSKTSVEPPEEKGFLKASWDRLTSIFS